MSPEISDLLKAADEAWEQEVTRRMNELKAGGAVTIPWEDAQRQIRARVLPRTNCDI